MMVGLLAGGLGIAVPNAIFNDSMRDLFQPPLLFSRTLPMIILALAASITSVVMAYREHKKINALEGALKNIFDAVNQNDSDKNLEDGSTEKTFGKRIIDLLTGKKV